MPEKSKKIWKQVDQYFADALIAPGDGFNAALDANRKADLPAIDVTPLQGKFLEILVRATERKTHSRNRHARRIQHALAGPRDP